MHAYLRAFALGLALACFALLCHATLVSLDNVTPNPTITSISPSTTGTLASGSLTTSTVNFSQAVSVTGGAPTLKFDTSPNAGAATYTSGSGASAPVFDYPLTVNQPINSVETASSAISLNGAAIPAGAATANPSGSNNHMVTGAAFAPSPSPAGVVSITPSPATGLLTSSSSSGAGNSVIFRVAFSNPVTVKGRPTLALTNSGAASYLYGSGTSTLTFSYTVVSGQNTPISASTANPTGNTYLGTVASGAISLPGGTTIGNGSTPATLTGANNRIFSGLSVNTSPAYFLSPSGSDSNACTYALPCATLTKAQTMMESGFKQVYLLPGTYSSSAYQAGSFNLAAGQCKAQSFVQQAGNEVAILCFNNGYSTVDNGFAILGYPATPTISCGLPSGALTAVCLQGGGSRNNILIYASVLNGLVINGITFNGYGGVVTANGGQNITESNNNFPNSLSGNWYNNDFIAPMWLTDAPGFPVGNIYVSHNTCTNSQGRCWKWSVNTWNGYLIVDSNIALNACQNQTDPDTGEGPGNGDCGPVESYNPNHTLVSFNCQWNDNIVEGYGNPTEGGDKGLYNDEYSAGCHLSGNQLYGSMKRSIQFHGGNLIQVTGNLIDVTNVGDQMVYYQTGSMGAAPDGYNGIMNGNVEKNNIILNLGGGSPGGLLLWTCEWDGTPPASGSAVDAPSFGGDVAYTNGGSFNFTAQNFGCGFTDSTTHITTNPLGSPNFTTGTYGERHYNVANPPPGWITLRTDQGPH